jgi:hypothetical protein
MVKGRKAPIPHVATPRLRQRRLLNSSLKHRYQSPLTRCAKIGMQGFHVLVGEGCKELTLNYGGRHCLVLVYKGVIGSGGIALMQEGPTIASAKLAQGKRMFLERLREANA